MLGKAAAMPLSLPQRQRQDVFYCPAGYQSEFTLFHTSRVIKYVFLDGSQNIIPASPPSPSFESPQLGYLDSTKGGYHHYPLVIPDHSLASSYWAPELERLPIFVTLSKCQQEKPSNGWGRPLYSWDRLPVFRQLCGEAVMSAPQRQEDVVAGPQSTEDEPEKAEDTEAQGLENELEEEEKQEQEEEQEEKEEEEEEEEEEAEAGSGMPPAASREQEATP